MKLAKAFWKNWIKFGQILGNFYAQVFLTLFYFLILWMIGIITKLFSDPLLIKRSKKSNFTEWIHSKDTLSSARNQY
ncbi:MAG: hypothetical protein COX79_01835 [Candidatus Levybacteria bacterium CG_4_10_14_0_2_um_filter_36_16]|nr:MAG: hypothetical protein AUK12_00390 [Candidatus Levybacteria bacterium CG2_30_37_29]PIR79467.1 MAG: hypothetical protein COU26_01000 [Candidatus Levybacteria bacterium CG10_big_fil_rev_8_21_14_0_10_36_30]PIZ97572.1 MAG: hypothetical protein COX79_01835 [Candidatus Levybacteria bacterium CG_4_10_14_0_2_um_filter_36_16]